jgi:hypothetical protein
MNSYWTFFMDVVCSAKHGLLIGFICCGRIENGSSLIKRSEARRISQSQLFVAAC